MALRPLSRLPFVLLLLLAAVTAFAPTADPDLWWHLRTGEVALRERSSLPLEIFSSRFAGQAWPYKDLLADALLWLIYRSGGYVGFFLLKLAAGLGLSAALALALPAPRRHPLVVLLVGGALLSAVGLVERPNLFTFMIFPLLLALLERARAAATQAAAPALLRAFGPPVLLCWLWAQLHRAVMVGFVLLAAHAAYLAAAWLLGRWARRGGVAAESGRLAALLGVFPTGQAVLAALLGALAAPLLGLLNPSGAALLRTSVGVVRSPLLRQYITEWLPVNLAAFLPSPGGGLVMLGALAAGLSLGAALQRGRRGPLCAWHAGLLLLFGSRLLVDSVRWQPYLSFSAALVLVLVLAEEEVQAALLRLSGGRRPRGLALGLGVALLGLQLSARPDPLALGESEALQPRGAVAFARSHGLRGPVLNAYGLGGYLIYTLWPQVTVLVDGRNDMIYPAPFVEQALQAQRDPALFAALHAGGDASWVMAWNRPDQVSHAFLAQNPAWALVYWDDVATVYVQRAAHPELLGLRYQLIDPQAVEGSVARVVARHQRPGGDAAVLQMLEGELLRMVEAAPRSLRANGALLILYSKLGPRYQVQRDAVLRHLDTFAADNPAIPAPAGAPAAVIR